MGCGKGRAFSEGERLRDVELELILRITDKLELDVGI